MSALLDGDIAEAFFQAVVQQARERNLLSDEHFTVDGTLLEAWASVKSYSSLNCAQFSIRLSEVTQTLDPISGSQLLAGGRGL